MKENFKNLDLDLDLVVQVEEGLVPCQQLDKTAKGRKVTEDGPFIFFGLSSVNKERIPTSPEKETLKTAGL